MAVTTGQFLKIEVSPKRLVDKLEADGGSCLVKVRLDKSNFNTAATTVDFDLTSWPTGTEIEGAYFVLMQNFAGGGSATATLSAGSTGTADAYIAATSVFSGASAGVPVVIKGKTLVPGTFLAGTGAQAPATVRVELVCDVNCSLLTTGKADFFLKLRVASVKNP